MTENTKGKRSMHVIGITGGVGCGKSTVLGYLRQIDGAVVAEADAIARRLQQPGQAVYQEMKALLGDGVICADGQLDRAAVAARLFADATLREKINGVVHPAVKCEVQQQIAQAHADGKRLFFLEAALLIEDHYEQICEEFWYICADDAVRAARLKASRGYSDEKFAAIAKSQQTKETFAAHCQVTIDNGGAFSHTKEQIDRQLARILKRSDIDGGNE